MQSVYSGVQSVSNLKSAVNFQVVPSSIIMLFKSLDCQDKKINYFGKSTKDGTPLVKLLCEGSKEYRRLTVELRTLTSGSRRLKQVRVRR